MNRRDFLRGSVGVGVAVVSGAAFAASGAPPVRIGVRPGASRYYEFGEWTNWKPVHRAFPSSEPVPVRFDQRNNVWRIVGQGPRL